MINTWERFFEKYDYGGTISQLASYYPDVKTLKVSFNDIDHFDEDLAEIVENSPDTALRAAEDTIKGMIEPMLSDDLAADLRIHVEVVDPPKGWRVPVRNIRERHIHKMIAVEGIAKRVVEVLPMALVAAYKCKRCNHIFMVKQDTPFMAPPLECPPKTEGGCGRAAGSTKFEYLVDQTIFIDSQKLEVQERPDGLRGGAQPQSLICYAYGPLTGMISPGDKIILSGIMRALPKKEKTTHEIYLDVNHIDLIDVQTEDIEINRDEQIFIDKLCKQPDAQNTLAMSIAPNIFGHETIKLALLLQMFGGVSKTTEEGSHLRGDPHILLIGDPGTAKTQFLRYVSAVVPRGVYASGKGSSAAGLTAACTRDDFGEGKWTLEAGALVLADGGMACVDELDKMSEADSSSMHEAMEQQTVTINKASIHTSLQSRCSVLAAANPKHGRFTPYSIISEQIDLPPTLFSRFDLIFAITDKPDGVMDGDIAEHILRSHLAGQVARRKQIGSDVVSRPRIEQAQRAVKPIVDPNLLRKYVWLGRRLIPVMSDGAMDKLKAFYQEIRRYGEHDNAPVPITARQLEGLIRLSEASARSRLSDEVTEDDAVVAIKITTDFLDRIIGSGNSQFDIDTIMGVPKCQRDMMIVLDRICNRLSTNGGWTYSQFEDAATEEGIDAVKSKHYFDQMRMKGDIYQKGTANGAALWLSI